MPQIFARLVGEAHQDLGLAVYQHRILPAPVLRGGRAAVFGEHLKGAAMHVERVHHHLAPDHPAFERALRGAGVEVVEDPEAATAVLRVTRSDAPRRLLSVQASGKAQEIELRQFLHFRLEDPSGELLLPEQRLEQRRDYYFDPNDPLGTTGQEPAIRRDMRRDIVQLMMLRLAARPD